MRVLLLATVLLAGCAAREASSTDNHNRVPFVQCRIMRYDGAIRQLCCDSTGCVFAQ